MENPSGLTIDAYKKLFGVADITIVVVGHGNQSAGLPVNQQGFLVDNVTILAMSPNTIYHGAVLAVAAAGAEAFIIHMVYRHPYIQFLTVTGHVELGALLRL